MRRDQEERGLIPRKFPPEPTGHRDSSISENPAEQPQPQPPPEATAPPQESSLAADAKMPYSLWLEVLNGKHRPEEHITEVRATHAHPSDEPGAVNPPQYASVSSQGS